MWGWAADSSCDLNTGTTPAQGCFWAEDDTNDWVQVKTAASPTDGEGNPVGFWWPTTAEYIAEWADVAFGGANEDYWYNVMSGYAVDNSGTIHADPGGSGATDPYIYTQQQDSSGTNCSLAEWNNGTISSPADPMYFFWQGCR
jgi:hypothetical protein